MGMPLNGFDPSKHPDPDQRQVIPAGKYLAAIVDSQEKPNSKGTGAFLELRFQILDGEFKDTPLWSRLNLKNPNETAVRIAQSELGMICRAVGIDQPRDSSDFHDLPMVIDVTRVPRKDMPGEFSNEIRGYYSKHSGASTRAAAAPQRPQAAAATGPVDRAPWE